MSKNNPTSSDASAPETSNAGTAAQAHSDMQSQHPNPKKIQHYDIVISGGGVVGCLAALALSAKLDKQQYKIALIEAGSPAPGRPAPGRPVKGQTQTSIAKSTCADSTKVQTTENVNKHAGFDARVIALAKRSLDILCDLGVDVAAFNTQDIAQIHVSDKGHIGQVQLSAAQQGVEVLGKVVAIEALGEYLLAQLHACPNVDYFCPASIRHIDKHPLYLALELEQSEHNEPHVSSLHTKLLLVSDGGNSHTRQMLGFESELVDYEQSAIVTNVEMQLPHKNTAYERFTAQGPIAFLPMNPLSTGPSNLSSTSDSASSSHSSSETKNAAVNKTSNQHTMSVVWCTHRQNLSSITSLSPARFAKQLAGLFGDKLGDIVKTSEPVTYPLKLSQVKAFTSHRAICIGNAAQSLHPIAGQGFNLGIRDVLDLTRCLAKFKDVGCFESTQSYYDARKADKTASILATDTLVKVFSNQYLPTVIGRNLGLLGMNKTRGAKQKFAAFAMGERK